MDTIFISELKVKTKLGVPAWERMVAQTVILDIEIGYDLTKACKSDAIADTIDYGAVVARIHETLSEHSFQLVEALAEHICQLIFKEFSALSVKIKVAKPAILPGLKALGVVIERKNRLSHPLG
jgi:dihydroneopterin aldolase